MKTQFLTVALATLAIFGMVSCSEQGVKIGQPLPLWQKGDLDIHMISTGHGDCTYLIFPDGTTFMNDASGALTAAKSSVEPRDLGKAEWKPNDTVSAGHTIVNYINHFSPAVSKGHINYFLLTHHHGDHMGAYNSSLPDHSSGLFKLTSICEIGSNIVIDKLFDRDWPDFSFPKEATGNMMSNYRAFLDWTQGENGSIVEKWDVGSDTQVTPLYDKSYGVVVRNLAGNGCALGADGECASFMPSESEFETMEKEAIPDENCFSCAYLLSYGKFDFFLGGDLQYKNRENYPYMDAETPLIGAIHKAEVMSANHHGYRLSHTTDFINKLAPDVWLVGVWTKIRHPDQGPTKRVIEANPDCDIFCTYQSSENIERLVEEIGQESFDRHFASLYGHIVVRVAPGGDSYMVYTLEDGDEEYVVKSIHGPYQCTD